MSKPKAKDSPLRDYMLELHRKGIKVTFYEGRPENPADRSQMFFVEMPAGYSLEEHVEILSRISKALSTSAAMSKGDPPQKLTRQVAESYITRLKLFKEQSGGNN